MRIRLNRRGWVVLVGVPVFLLALAGTLLVTMFSNSVMASAYEPVGVQTVEVTVLPGDTLWGLASEFAEGYDVDSAVRYIGEMNSLEGATLQAGQTLQIPVLDQP
ncbi:LysM peptidoglycan-binding domain-containing protein [Glutamicibacter sp. MNS18]|uniref:LysM peptidoglycan-binding domain-containing protein n=1 Tax=Glutamicibacter sp. MNS18 TaxID=2989817 RepID=UPI0022361B79|nr:LysM peptidoglycan-binding domain-containing protein [Glutamicibacter sp. MNS18]MCW4465350.1 LysM peptidoglycan-binding domain-containing protein [Glutamicibacter sp. MNS18]